MNSMSEHHLMVEQWKKLLEIDMQDLHRAASKKYPVDKAQELETTIAEFLVDLAATNGIPGAPIMDSPKVVALQTRAALMTFLISLVWPL